MNWIKYFFIFMLMFLSNNLSAQYKYEKEVRLKSSEVPTEMYEYVKRLVPGVRVRWYKEFGFDSNSFEAKFKHKANTYSVEFYQNGMLKDVEILIRIADVDQKLFENIDAKLKAELSSYRITRLQRQIIASKDEIQAYFKNKSVLNELKQHYEIELWTRVANEIVMFVYLFDKEANVIKKRRVVDQPSDNLIY